MRFRYPLLETFAYTPEPPLGPTGSEPDPLWPASPPGITDLLISGPSSPDPPEPPSRASKRFWYPPLEPPPYPPDPPNPPFPPLGPTGSEPDPP